MLSEQNYLLKNLNFKFSKGFAEKLMNTLVSKWDIWNDMGSLDERLLKASLAEYSCRANLKSCLSKATELFNAIPEEYFLIPQNISIINPLVQSTMTLRIL